MPFVECLWFEVFVEKEPFEAPLNKTVAMEAQVCHVIKLWTSFQKNLTVSC